MYKAIPLALLGAAVPAIVRAQTTPIVEISQGHGHTFTLESSQSRIVKAWPGIYESFDFGEHPKIPNAKFIFVKLKPGAKLSSTTLTLIVDDGSGKETTKSYILKRVKGIPSQTTTLIGNQPVYAAQPVPPATPSNVFSPPTNPDKQISKEKKGKKPKKLKVSGEFGNSFSSGSTGSEGEEKPIPTKESEQPEPEETDDTDVPDPAKSKPQTQPQKPQLESLPLIRAPKIEAKATEKTPSETQLIERSSLDNYEIANHLLKGLYEAERKKQINSSKPQFGQTHSMARRLREGLSVDKSLQLSGLPAVTFDNLLGHGGVGK